MNNLANYNIKVPDWRKQLRVNERRTYWVMTLFVAIYLFIGLLLDLSIHYELAGYTFNQALTALATFQVVPSATLVMGAVALFSIFITFAMHDKLMLLGTEYREITHESAEGLNEQQLYDVVEELKIASGMRYMPKLYIIEADFLNAFASGYSEKSALIAISRGLLEKLTRGELQAVIAHELSHIRHNDIKLTLMASVLANIILIVIDIMFRGVIYGGGRRRDNRLATVVIFLRFFLPLITILLTLYLSRKREFMADAGAVELTRENTALASALIKISDSYANNREQLNGKIAHDDIRRSVYIFDPAQAAVHAVSSVATLFSTHPPLQARLQALGVAGKL